MKIKSTKTSILYAGREIISPGGYFDGDAISDSIETTAQAFELVGAAFKRMEHHLNNQATRTFSCVRDFDSIEGAVLYKLEAEEHATENPTGTLSITVGNSSRSYSAGLTSLTSNISLAPNAVRLVLVYAFMTGERI